MAPELPSEPSHPAQEVGEALRATRLKRGYSLDSVSQHTRISRRFLEALEMGRFDDLPAPVYLRSFLTDYCDYLELDVRPLWEKLQTPAAVAATPGPAAAPAHPPARASRTPGEPSPHLRALVSAANAVALSAALGMGLAWWATAKRAPSGPVGQPVATSRTAPELKLGLVAHDDAWVGLRADGSVLYAGRLPKNAHQEWASQGPFRLRASAPESLTLTLNGAAYRLPRPDEKGEFRIAP